MNPKEILFSLPSLCDPIPATQPGAPGAAHRALHEDDWRQIEFVPLANRDYIQAKLSELAAFKHEHQRGCGFAKLLIRPEHPIAFGSVGLATAQMPHFPIEALTLGGGAVHGGFAVPDRTDWFIYGQCAPDRRILHLAVSPGRGEPPSEQFLQALTDLSVSRFLLVDWYVGIVVDTASPDALLSWTRRFQ